MTRHKLRAPQGELAPALAVRDKLQLRPHGAQLPAALEGAGRQRAQARRGADVGVSPAGPLLFQPEVEIILVNGQ